MGQAIYGLAFAALMAANAVSATSLPLAILDWAATAWLALLAVLAGVNAVFEKNDGY